MIDEHTVFSDVFDHHCCKITCFYDVFVACLGIFGHCLCVPSVNLVRPCAKGLYATLYDRLYETLCEMCLHKPCTSDSAAEVVCAIACALPAILQRVFVRGLYGFVPDGFFR